MEMNFTIKRDIRYLLHVIESKSLIQMLKNLIINIYINSKNPTCLNQREYMNLTHNQKSGSIP